MEASEKARIAADVRTSLVRRGVPLSVAAKIVQRASSRVKTSCCGGCRGGGPCGNGLGADIIPTSPIAIKTGETISDRSPARILANISAAGDDPTVTDARNIVSKWSWLIPVGGLLMNLKNKITGGGSPTAAAMVGSGRRR